MMKTWLLAIPVLASFGATSAHAAILDARFSGPVASQSGTGLALGSTISGEFVLNTDTGAFASFTIADVSAAVGAGSSASLTPDGYSAIYRSQLSPVQQGGAVNNSLTVDLEGINPFVSPVLPGSAVALLTNTSELATNLDTGLSTLGFYQANADGTNVRQVSADLTSFSVAVPEPASIGLLTAACLGLGVRRRRA